MPGLRQKFAVREATPDEAEEYQKQLSENIGFVKAGAMEAPARSLDRRE